MYTEYSTRVMYVLLYVRRDCCMNLNYYSSSSTYIYTAVLIFFHISSTRLNVAQKNNKRRDSLFMLNKADEVHTTGTAVYTCTKQLQV